MSPGLINSETICDLQGQPLHRESVTLLKALDKLLTVGAYYSVTHEQYLQAAMSARDDIVGVIGGPGHHVAIEITAQGLMIGHQNIDPHHRNVRQIHALLVPLNIARLEIEGTLSPEDLRQTLAALQQHKAALGQVSGFQEVVIENLPDSVRAVSCSVLRKSDGASDEEPDEDTSGGGSTLDDLLGKWDESPVVEQPQAPANESAVLSQRFLDLVTRILANLEALADETGHLAGKAGNGSYITVEDLMDLKRSLEHLVEINPDPAELALLITQAEQALGLSRDAKSVDLVFQILKKDMVDKKSPQKHPGQAKSRVVKFQFTVTQLMAQVTELESDPTAIADPQTGSRSNQLGLALQLLRSDPPRALRATIVATLEQLVGRPDFAEQNGTFFAQATAAIITEEETAGLDDLLPQLTGILRQKQPRMVGPFWSQIVAAVPPTTLAGYWPYLVNDILLGLDHSSREEMARLALAAGSLPVAAARSEAHRLEKQPALQGKSAARDLFVAPLPEIHSVLTVLLASPLKEWAGEKIFEFLRKRPLSRLVDLVLAALGGHDPSQHDFYLEMIQHGRDENPPACLQITTAAIMGGCLENLLGAERARDWVPAAITEMAHLAPETSGDLLVHIQSERKLFFFKAWPAPARRAAELALQAMSQEVQ